MSNYKNAALSCLHNLVDYKAPIWASHLKCIPKQRVKLAVLPTPIHKWTLDGLPKGIDLYIKRDDMTGSCSSNKIRKLEFLLAEAITQGCQSVITCGGIQSNHCRTTAVIAREMGLDCHLFLRSDTTDMTVLDYPGNLLPSLLCGSHIYLIPKNSKYIDDIEPKQRMLANKILEETKKPSFCIPVGGSNSIGVFGYINAWEEMMVEQNLCEMFDDIVVACGSGGTLAGLAIGNYLTGQKLKIHGITVCDDKKYFYHHLNEILLELGILNTKAEKIADIIDGYKGSGYGNTTVNDCDFYQRIARTTGIMCDPVYTGKALNGMITELTKNLQRFQGNRILFIHTGGIYSLYDGKMMPQLQRVWKDNVHKWPENSLEPQKRL